MAVAKWNGVVIAESDQTVVVEGNHYFPRDAVWSKYLMRSDTKTHCPWKGDASYYTLDVGGNEAQRFECIHGDQVGAEKDVGVPETSHHDVVGRPGADALEFEESCPRLMAISSDVELDRAIGGCRGDTAHRVASGRRHGEEIVGGVGKAFRRREGVCQRGLTRQLHVDRLTQRGDQSAGDRACTRQRDLLADDGTDRGLRRVGAGGCSPARGPADQCGQPGVRSECFIDGRHSGFGLLG